MSKFVNAICNLYICFDSVDNYQNSIYLDGQNG